MTTKTNKSVIQSFSDEITSKATHVTKRDTKLKDDDIDTVCELVMQNVTSTQIAKELKVGLSTFYKWLDSDKDRKLAYAYARNKAAKSIEDYALELLVNAKDNFEVSKAHAIAQFAKWRASKYDASSYGEKVTHEVNGAIDNTIEIVFKKADAVAHDNVIDVTHTHTPALNKEQHTHTHDDNK
jgi:transposase